MNAQDIETYLADVGSELGRAGLPSHTLRILMIGGAYMLTQVGNRPATKDVDIVFTDVPDPTTSPLYRPFQAAVRAVALRHALPVNWLNDVIGDALRNYGPVPQGTPWRSYGPLEVYIPNAEYVLALKLLAGRPQDMADARALCQRLGVTTQAEARRILDTYITDTQIKQLNNVDVTLLQLFL